MQKKVKQKHIEDAEEYANSIGVNLGDLDGYNVQHIFPKNTVTRKKYEIMFKKQAEYDNDLYDNDIERDTILNRPRQFTERIPMDEIDNLSDEDYISYHLFLADYRQDQLNERKISHS